MTSTKTFFFFMFVALFALVSAQEEVDQGSMRLSVRYTSPALLRELDENGRNTYHPCVAPACFLLSSLYMQGTS
jgi:hypothetical protein